jgi:hypothetical protein
MNEFDLHSLQDILDRMYSLEESFKQERDLGGTPDKSDIQYALSAMTEAQAYCSQEVFEDAGETIERIVNGFEYETRDFSTMVAELRHVRNALYDEVNKRVFLRVEPDRRDFVNDMEFLGHGVSGAFPSARHDIVEAGNCLAADCNTAGVFHLMRAVEWGLRALCADLGLRRATRRTKSGNKKYTPISYVDWETMLNQLQDKVDMKLTKLKRGNAKQSAQEFYYPILQDIRAIRDAWRNHVMHTRANYNRTDADAVLSHVRRLMGLLATREH